DELYRARIFVGSDLGFHVFLEFVADSIIGISSVAQHHEGLHDLAAFLVGSANHGALQHLRMIEQRRLDLRARDLVAGADNQVVGASHVPEISLLIHAIGVASDVPSILYILLLLRRSIEIAAAGGTARGQPSN